MTHASDAGAPPRIAIICHEDDPMNRTLILTWLASFSTVVGVVLISEDGGPRFRRIRAEYRRVGLLRLADVLLFRLHYRLFHARSDHRWEQAEIQRRCAQLPPVREGIPLLTTHDPNEMAVVTFLRRCAPDLTVARCKWLLRKAVYSAPARGTFVIHPGICPQYRNAHGCFWALANRDLGDVGATLLQIDEGIDTGPIYAFYRYAFDELAESHIRIQHRTVLENLDALRATLLGIAAGRSVPLEVRGQVSRNWGQPWLSAYLRYRRTARRAHG
jgi:folate-dependent phosphoribosylglycinamide formyltransferase PurN